MQKSSYRNKRRYARRKYNRKNKRYTKNIIKQLNPYGVHSFQRTVSCGDEYAVGNLTLNAGGMTSLNVSGGYIVLTTSAAVANNFSGFGYQFSIASLPGLSDFTSLFDIYQLNKVVVRFIPMSNVTATTVAGAPNGNPAVSGFMHYCIDNDDFTIPTTSEVGINDLRQYPSYRMRRLVDSKGWTITVKPKTANTVYRTGVSSAYAQGKSGQWLDLAYTDIPHYGLKGIFETVNPNAQASVIWLRVETTYHMKFKGVR